MMLRRLALLAVTLTLSAQESTLSPTPVFLDRERAARLKAAMPEVEKVFEKYHRERRLPGSAWGVVIDGQLVFVKTYGVRDRKANDPVTPDTAFRIASMTKSFTAAALLKLRDEGKLSLDDRVEKWIPEFRGYRYPTADTEPLRVRQLVTHGAGFPEDNPWGDRQLGESDKLLGDWIRKGIPFSTPPDTEYEYSNYGFALAGRVIAKASGMSYRDYVESKILKPLGMTTSSLEPSALPANARATGYGLRDNEYFEIESLPHGSFGAMGGLVTTAKDLSKWIAFQLSAFPPRDEADAGPVKRASLREMQRLQRPGNFFSERNRASSGGYGYGLGISRDCRFDHIVGHGGGLPGFGSYMMWLPSYGVGMLAMTNLTYQGPSQALSEAFDVLHRTGALRPRELAPAPVLTSTREAIVALWNRWDDAAFNRLAANNLAMDLPAANRRKAMETLREKSGVCRAPGGVQPENWLRGAFRMPCEKGEVEVTFTLAPTNPPTVQYLQFAHIAPLNDAMQSLAVEAVQSLGGSGGSCRLAGVLAGDGATSAVVRIDCGPAARGAAAVLTIDKEGKRNFQLRRAPGATCAP